jgi:hypothetical protein
LHKSGPADVALPLWAISIRLAGAAPASLQGSWSSSLTH